MPPRIPHIFENGIEKKRCSKCRQYLPLNNYIYKKDRYDKLANECNKCRKIRNKRRYNPNYEYEYTEVIEDGNNGSEKNKEEKYEEEKSKDTKEKEI